MSDYRILSESGIEKEHGRSWKNTSWSRVAAGRAGRHPANRFAIRLAAGTAAGRHRLERKECLTLLSARHIDLDQRGAYFADLSHLAIPPVKPASLKLSKSH
jgi:hypothetical protein